MFAEYCNFDYSLRDYQQLAKEEIFSQWDNVDNIMYQMPTGTGKTRLFTSIIRDISLKALQERCRKRIIIIAHRTELIEQIGESLSRYRIPHGIIAGNFREQRDLLQQIQVASIQTITHPSNRKLAYALDADFVIIDEAHHAIANSYKKLWEFYPSAKKLGVTATPWRMDGVGFRGSFDILIPSMSIREFMRAGWLAPYKYYSVQMDCSLYENINKINEFGIDGDYKTSVLEGIMDTSRIRVQLLESYFQYVKGKKGIIYSISRLHSKHICQQYKDAGIRIADIDSDTPAQVRKKLVQDFKNGDLDIIVNVDIFSEGFDCPNLEFVQLARPTKSLVKYIQQIGRGLRINGSKQCYILDNVGMYGRFGLPDDDRPWNQYFDGVPNKDNKKNATLHSDVLYKGIPLARTSNLTEGVEEMSLIQSIEITSKAAENINDDENQLKDLKGRVEIISPIIFAKYRIYEDASGFGILNVRSNERQHLSDHLKWKSASIKVQKTPEKNKTFTIISSLSCTTKISTSDRVIGYLYKEGRLTRFSTINGKINCDIKI